MEMNKLDLGGNKGGGIQTINGSKPDKNGNINVGVMTEEQEQGLEQALLLNGRVEVLEGLTDITADVDFKTLPKLCGQPMTLFGAGTPQESIVPENWKQYDPVTGEGYQWNGQPSALGQVYINTAVSTNGRYTAVENGYGNLKWVNF